MLQRGLIVSCQAPAESPLRNSHAMLAVLQEAVAAGATGIRMDGSEDVRAVRGAVESSVVGIYEYAESGYEVYITSGTRRARVVTQADADIITLAATLRPCPEWTAKNLIRRIKAEFGLPVFADVSTREEGVATASASADHLGATFSGYTGGASDMAVRIP